MVDNVLYSGDVLGGTDQGSPSARRASVNERAIAGRARRRRDARRRRRHHDGAEALAAGRRPDGPRRGDRAPPGRPERSSGWSAAGPRRRRLFERRGVAAAVVPAIPDRSIPNSVATVTRGALEAAIGDLAAAYAEAGVGAWMVWVPEDDRDVAALLEAPGCALDATPAAMSLELADLAEPESGDLDWDAAPSRARWAGSTTWPTAGPRTPSPRAGPLWGGRRRASTKRAWTASRVRARHRQRR